METFRRFLSKIDIIEKDFEDYKVCQAKIHMDNTILVGVEVKKLESTCKFKKDHIEESQRKLDNEFKNT